MPNKTLNLAIDGDILELAVMRRMYEMAKKEEYLKQHRFKVYQGKDGRWFTYVPDPRKETGRRQVASGIPCGRDYFYDRYRKFFWILDQIREKM